MSPFARSVACHVRALVDGGNSREEYDIEEAGWESRYERHMNEEKEKRRQMKIDKNVSSGGSVLPVTGQGSPLPTDDMLDSNQGKMVTNGTGSNVEPRRKRTRKQVDYKHLYQQVQRESF